MVQRTPSSCAERSTRTSHRSCCRSTWSRARSGAMSNASMVTTWTSGAGRNAYAVPACTPWVVAEPRTPGRGAREVARELLPEHRSQPALGGRPGVVAVLVVADGGVEVEVVLAEPLDVLRVVRRGREPRGRRPLGRVVDRPEVAGVVRVATPAAVDQVAGHQHRVRLLPLPVVEDVVDRPLVGRAGGVGGPAGVPEARSPAQIGDVGVQEVRARQQPQPAWGVRRPGQHGAAGAAVAMPPSVTVTVSGPGATPGPDLDRELLRRARRPRRRPGWRRPPRGRSGGG